MTIAVFASEHRQDAQGWINDLQDRLPNVLLQSFEVDGATTGAELAIVWKPPRDLLLREPTIKVLFNLGAGVDALLDLPGLGDDVRIVRLEDAGMGVQMAEYVLHALLRASRRFADYEAHQRAGHWQALPAIRRRDWPVGILGMGVMGQRVARTLADLEYPVNGWSRSRKDMTGVTTFAGTDGFLPFLEATRVLVNLLPLTDATRGILCSDHFRRLKADAYLINVGRGEHLVEDDLLAALADGALAGATLDVFRDEPLPPDHPFWHHERITITPHIAAASLREETIDQIATKVVRYLRGESITGVVDRHHGY